LDAGIMRDGALVGLAMDKGVHQGVKIIPALLFCFLVASCFKQRLPAALPIATATTRPEVTINNVPAARIESELVSACSATLRGSVSHADPGEVVCAKLPSTGFNQAAWVTANMAQTGGSCTDQAIFRIRDMGGSARVTASRTLTTFNESGARLNSQEWRSFDADLQQLLESVKRKVTTQQGNIAESTR
jgi:hypothetical protein